MVLSEPNRIREIYSGLRQSQDVVYCKHFTVLLSYRYLTLVLISFIFHNPHTNLQNKQRFVEEISTPYKPLNLEKYQEGLTIF